MGLLRFILSLFVVISHANTKLDENFLLPQVHFNIGAFAVIIFYILSGYYQSNRISKGVERFYIDRIWRIFPIFIIAFIFNYSIFYLSENVIWNFKFFIFTFLNLLIIPTTFFYLIPDWIFYHQKLVIQTSPSLGLEICFYLILPFLAGHARIWILISLLFFIGSVIGVFHPYNISYVGIPGTVFLFLTGFLLGAKKKENLLFLMTIFFVILAMIGLLMSHPSWRVPHLLEVAVGFCVGTTIIALRALFFNGLKMGWVEPLFNFLGYFSYPIFLTHGKLLELMPQAGFLFWLILFLINLPIAFLDQYIQSWRRNRFI